MVRARDDRHVLVRVPAAEPLLPPTYAAVLWVARFRLEAVFQLAAWGTALLSTIVKAFMRRPRPVASRDLRVVAAPLGGSSFPSGHVLTYVGVYGWMAFMANRLIGPVLPWPHLAKPASPPRVHRPGDQD